MSDWFIPWERSIVAIMGTRLLLNLRGQIEEQRTDDSRFMLHNLNDSEPNHTLQSTTPSAPVARVAWPSRARRGRGMSVHDHDPPADSEGGSVHRDSEDVPLDLEMTRVKGSWKLGSSSKTEADASESEPPPPPPPWRPWKTRCPNDNPSWL
ncbi:hypothetical protein FRB90_000303 [Tulasnella sp. 427]|nr:hypothetical protein FRB90_000303 [Tulasnella sp. 427]